ncbi:myosin-2 heavy chain isoform X5 [Schistocerca gregaria]|uniref:myosin-2 heavy chain isoform X5 n=1 Tax=Schistocerca gregaria TaxID=7010 RepID=UPI00211E5688|nr:myosin-2 heavy chain isoform X5 [Schistocerca gregaria]
MYSRQFPASKGDPLCPLGFHPQVRWPTRCKRCFRDYKEHGGRGREQSDSLRRDEATSSSPSLSSWATSSSPSRSRDDSRSSTDSGLGSSSSSRSSWLSSSSQSEDSSSSSSSGSSSRFGTSRPASSWTSTPDLGNLKDDTTADIATSFSFTLPRRKPQPQPQDTGQDRASSAASATYYFRRHTSDLSHLLDLSNHSSSPAPPEPVKQQKPTPSPSRAQQNEERENINKQRRLKIQSLKEVHSVDAPTNPEVEFIIQVKKSAKNKDAAKNNAVNNKSKTSSIPTSSSSSSGTSSEDSIEDESSDDDATSTAGTETTETTLVNDNELQDQIESLKQELETTRSRCERLEREKSDLLLRRIASIDMAPSKTAASEVLKLQQKVNELQTQLEDVKDDKKSLSLRVKELEEELETRPDKNATQRVVDDLRSKLLAAETLCEELMDENEDMKKELRDLEEEIEELQDNFREDQADEYTSLKKELEQTAKNCRILSFKLRKAERRAEQMEAEKLEAERKCRELAGGQMGLDKTEQIKHMEQELAVANEVAIRLQKELDEALQKLKAQEEVKEDKKPTKKPPMLGSIGKTSSGEKLSRESLTRGGSQDDPAQLLRDLQDAMEREADLREQLRFAEEEAQRLRKKSARVEDDNESLVLQLKKMATKARSHRNSPGPARLTPEPPIEKDEGISDEEDPAELRLLLELNEQEAAVLRRKVEELEKEGETLKKKVKDLQDKLSAKTTRKSAAAITTPEPAKGSDVLYEQKIKVLEDELSELRKKLIEKERDCERLHAELTVTQKRFSKGAIQKSKSLDSSTDQQTLDLKRQLQVIEQEAAILRTRTQALETENEKLTAENKKLQLVRATKKTINSIATDETSDRAVELKERIADLERQLEEANKKVKELQTKIDEQEDEKKTTEPKKKTVSPEVSKLRKEVKAKTEELEKLKTNFTKTESENEKLNQELKRLKDEALQDVLKYYKQRSPKKPTDLTTKVQMKKMVEDLENEIGDILVILNKSETENLRLKGGLKASASVEDDKLLKEAKDKLEKDLEKATTRVDELERELKEEKDKAEKDRKKAVKDKKVLEEGKKKSDEEKQKLEAEKKLWESDKKKHEETVRKLEDEKRRATEEAEKLFKEKQILEDQVITLNAEKAAATVKQDEITLFVKRIEALKTELEEEKKQGVEQRKKLESLQKMEQEKNRLQKEVTENSTKMAELEKKAKETEEKLKRTERILSTNKNKVSKLEKELEEEKERARAAEVTQQGVAASWLAERDGLKQQIATLQSQIDSLEATLGGKTVLIEQLEKTLKEERESVSDATEKARSAERNEISTLQDKLSSSKGEIEELTKKLEKAEKNLKANEEKNKKLEAELKTQRSELETKVSGIEANLQAEKKKCERLKANQEKELKNREQELTSLRTKLKTLESNSGASTKKLTEVKQEYQEKIDKLEEELANEKQEYEDLTTKYEMLEEEHVVTKAQLVMEKETLQGQLLSLKRELASAESELRTLRETYNSKQDAWIKEKLDQQEKLKELEAKTARNADEAWAQEKARLKTIVEEKNKEIESVKKEKRVFSDQADHFRKENEELRRKLDDFEKVAKVQRNISGETTVMEKEIREMKNKLYQEEKSHKAEVAQLKLRYDNQMALIGEEIQSLQAQVTRFKRERDNYRHMLDAAQKTIADLKAMPQKSRKDSKSADGDVDEDEEMRNKIASLEQQVSCMEDELSEARLESSKLKTELVSERSSWEIKLAEMQSRVNELEEDRILSTGRTKIAGMRTRMELAWQKEREEQHRLLQETSTLARDLRQTLFEVERERDKERLEAKRRLDQLKKSTEEEQEENKKKVSELQCDLLELRDAHAKLRTTNEKLRREKERYEKEREEMRQVISARKRADQDEERKVNMIIQQVDELMRLAPDLFSGKEKAATTAASTAQSPSTPTPPRRLKGPKSRESSPSLERKEFVKESSVDRKIQLQTTMQKLTEVTEELRKQQKLTEEERDRDRARRAMGMRRAASTESDNPPEVRMRPKTGNSKGIQQKGSLYRKSLSLEQTSAQEQQSIWTDTENEGSLSSLQSVGSDTFYPLKRRETSMDSRLSGGSTQSETPHSTEKKKKKSLLGKLKKLTKSRSTEETNTASDYPMSASAQGSDFGGSGSDISTGGQEDRGSKKDMRDRLTGMFKKSGSRSNSLERSTRGIKDQSPALSDRSESVAKKSGTLPRPSPSRSDVGPTSSMARPLSPGVKRPTTPTIPSNTTKLHRPK